MALNHNLIRQYQRTRTTLIILDLIHKKASLTEEKENGTKT